MNPDCQLRALWGRRRVATFGTTVAGSPSVVDAPAEPHPQRADVIRKINAPAFAEHLDQLSMLYAA
jgi:hypothetical protein